MRLPFPPAAQERAARAIAPISDTTPFAVAVKLGIRYEAVTRAVWEQEKKVLALSTGRHSRMQSGRYKERDLAREYRQESGALDARDTGDGISGRRPAVNWHDGGSGEPLLLLNGWNASGLTWPTEWLRRLERRFRVIRVDNRGSGWSRWAPAPYTLSTLADDARDVLRACGIERATTLGLSMGGMIAQELAFRHPDSVGRLILVGTRPPTPAQVPSDLTAFLTALREPRKGQDRAEYFREIWSRFAAPGFAERNPEAMHDLVGSIVRRPTPRSAVLNQSRAIGSWYDPDRLTKLTMPTLVVHGTRDPLMPVGNGMRLTRLIPGARYVELSGVGHLVPYEAPDELATLIESPVG